MNDSKKHNKTSSSEIPNNCKPVLWALQWDGGPVNHFTIYTSRQKAEDYIEQCNHGEEIKDQDRIKVVPLCVCSD